MLVPEIPPPFQPGEPLSASKFNRALNPLQQLANLHVYPPLVLEQDPTGYHIRLNWDLLTYIGGDITNPINFYNSATFWNLVNFSQATLIFPSSQPVNLYQGLIWIIPGSCSMYYYCDGKIKKVTATDSGGGGGSPASGQAVDQLGVAPVAPTAVTLYEVSAPGGLMGFVSIKATTGQDLAVGAEWVDVWGTTHSLTKASLGGNHRNFNAGTRSPETQAQNNMGPIVTFRLIGNSTDTVTPAPFQIKGFILSV